MIISKYLTNREYLFEWINVRRDVMDAISAVIQGMQNIGIGITDEFTDDFDLRDYIVDSLVFISFVLELENILEIELPYEMLLYDQLASCRGFCAMLTDVISDQKSLKE